jgi:hypothetical protein
LFIIGGGFGNPGNPYTCLLNTGNPFMLYHKSKIGFKPWYLPKNQMLKINVYSQKKDVCIFYKNPAYT